MLLKKVLALVISSGLLLSLSACFHHRRLWIDDDQRADARFGQIADAIGKRDKEALRILFSNYALEETVDMGGGIDYVFSLVQGEVISWECDKWSSDTSNSYGEKVLMIRSWYKLTTDEGDYSFFILDYNVDTKDANNVGIYALRAIKAGDEKKHFTYWQDMQIPGIFIPE